MAERLFLVDIDKCVRCYACEVACKQENEFGPGLRPCLVTTIGPRRVRGELHLDFVPTTCVHCEDPLCTHVCATNAIVKGGDGVLLIEEEKCTGCELCIHGCPYGAIHFNQEKNVAVKCNLCVDRTGHGIEPSCVKHCIGGALQFITREELDEISRGKHRVKIERNYYISSKWRLNPP